LSTVEQPTYDTIAGIYEEMPAMKLTGTLPNKPRSTETENEYSYVNVSDK